MEDIPSRIALGASETAPAASVPAPWRPAVLHLLRWMIDSYRAPERDGWCKALNMGREIWGENRGALIFADLAQVLAQMREARHSPFGFGRAETTQAAATRHEALFLQVIALVLADRPAQAEAVATILCEGNDTAAYLASVRRLARQIGADTGRNNRSA